MTTLIQQLVEKMGLQDEPNVLDKTTELLRLLDLRSTNVPLQVNEYGKIVICADLAATLLDIAFDKEQALKLSGLRKSLYANNKRMFEKLLDLNKIVGVTEICVKLDLNDVSKKALELLELYKKVVANENTDIDIMHPQYATMAVFYACKLAKKKVAKTKLMPFSNLRPAQWMQLEQRWEKFMTTHYKSIMDNKLKKQMSDEANIKDAQKNTKEQCADKRAASQIEDYENWKKRMLAMAESKLEAEKQQDEMEKENMILGM